MLCCAVMRRNTTVWCDGIRCEVVERRANFNLAKANKRLHLVEGFLAALTDLDQIVKTIRAANDGMQQPSDHPVPLIANVSHKSHVLSYLTSSFSEGCQ